MVTTTSASDRAELCGVRLRPSVVKVLVDVETSFRHPVLCKAVSNLAVEQGGRASETVLPNAVQLFN